MKPYYHHIDRLRSPLDRDVRFYDLLDRSEWAAPSRAGRIRHRKAKRRRLNKRARRASRAVINEDL